MLRRCGATELVDDRLAAISSAPVAKLDIPGLAPKTFAMKDEMILVVRRALFEQLGAFQGVNFEVDRYLPVMLDRANNFFSPRAAAEDDPSLKQIIPYVLL